MIASRVPAIPEDQKEKELLLSTLSTQFADQRWGKLSLENIDEEQGIIDVRLQGQPFESCKLPETTPVCFFLRGAIAGMLSALFEVDLKIKDIDCQKETKNCRYVFEPV